MVKGLKGYGVKSVKMVWLGETPDKLSNFKQNWINFILKKKIESKLLYHLWIDEYQIFFPETKPLNK